MRFLKNPEKVYEHQQKLFSTQAEIKELRKKQRRFTDLLNGLPTQRKNFSKQQAANLITFKQLQGELIHLDEQAQRYRGELTTIDDQLATSSISKGNLQALTQFAERYKDVIANFERDRKGAYDLLHALIDYIVVDSRPAKEGDIIAGKRKQDQKIPNLMIVVLKLPNEMIKEGAKYPPTAPAGRSDSSTQNLLNGRDAGN
jgi:hypothetical protein